MPARALRMCARCHSIAVVGTSYCERHATYVAQRDRQYKDSNALRKLYNSKRWRVVRQSVLFAHPQCSFVDDRGHQCYSLATDVHHITQAVIWVARGGDFFDESNLEALCHAHHSAHTAREVGFAGWNTSECKASERNSLITKRLGDIVLVKMGGAGVWGSAFLKGIVRKAVAKLFTRI